MAKKGLRQKLARLLARAGEDEAGQETYWKALRILGYEGQEEPASSELTDLFSSASNQQAEEALTILEKNIALTISRKIQELGGWQEAQPNKVTEDLAERFGIGKGVLRREGSGWKVESTTPGLSDAPLTEDSARGRFGVQINVAMIPKQIAPIFFSVSPSGILPQEDQEGMEVAFTAVYRQGKGHVAYWAPWIEYKEHLERMLEEYPQLARK